MCDSWCAPILSLAQAETRRIFFVSQEFPPAQWAMRAIFLFAHLWKVISTEGEIDSVGDFEVINSYTLLEPGHVTVPCLTTAENADS